MDANPRLISVKDAAGRLGVATITAYRWAESGKIPSIRLGGRRLVMEGRLNALINPAIPEGA